MKHLHDDSLSWSALERYCHLNIRVAVPQGHGNDGVPTDQDIANSLNLHRITIVRWRDNARLSGPAADRAACALGVHPSWIWGNEYWDVLESSIRFYEHHRAEKRAAA